jgi:hypothetical protein
MSDCVVSAAFSPGIPISRGFAFAECPRLRGRLGRRCSVSIVAARAVLVEIDMFMRLYGIGRILEPLQAINYIILQIFKINYI